MYDYANEVLKGTFTADVQSSSYGYREDQNCVINPIAAPCANGGVSAYIKATNTLFQQVGATGVTLVVASVASRVAWGGFKCACLCFPF